MIDAMGLPGWKSYPEALKGFEDRRRIRWRVVLPALRGTDFASVAAVFGLERFSVR